MTRNETTARNFNESIDYFVMNYGNPFEDCAINLCAAYRDLRSVDEGWANGTIRKTIKRMPKSIILNVLCEVNSAANRARFSSNPEAVNAVFDMLRNEASDRNIYF